MGIRPCLIHFEKKEKEIIFSSNIKVFKNHESICKLGAFDHDSFILKKRKRNQLFLKYQGFQKSCINLQTRGIQPCLIHFQKKRKRNKISKYHASISKFGAFGHASSILKKKKINSSLKVKVFKIMLQFVD